MIVATFSSERKIERGWGKGERQRETEWNKILTTGESGYGVYGGSLYCSFNSLYSSIFFQIKSFLKKKSLQNKLTPFKKTQIPFKSEVS